jgi:integrase
MRPSLDLVQKPVRVLDGRFRQPALAVPVFTDELGRPMHPHAVFGYFERAVRDSGLPPLNFHGLRHSHATVLLQAGVPVRVVAERLGHADPAMTLRVYQHVVPGMQCDAAARAADVIFRER